MPDDTALTPTPDQSLGPASDLIAAWLEGRAPSTIRAYERAIAHFAEFAGQPDAATASRALLAGGPGLANRTVLAYRALLRDRGLAPSTVNHRLAAIRSLVKVARLVGMVTWAIEVPGLKVRAYRDTRGPGRHGVRALLEATADPSSPREVRDRAVLRLLADLALRRGEVVALDVDHVETAAERIQVLGKGRLEPEPMTLPPPTMQAIGRWTDVRGRNPGPLFVSVLKGGRVTGKRLRGSDVYRIVQRAGRIAGIENLRPHGLRHAAITQALDLSRGNVRAVRRFSRHSDPRTLLAYDDNREDLAGEIARQVAEWA